MNKVAQYSANPQHEHWVAIKSIMRYLIGKDPTIVFDDNQSATAIAKNPQFIGKRNTLILDFITLDQVEKETIKIIYCPSKDMLADILTKGLQKYVHNNLAKLMNIAVSDSSVNVGMHVLNMCKTDKLSTSDPGLS